MYGWIDKYQTNVESEDRIYSRQPYITNIRKYIKYIDINVNSPLMRYVDNVKELIAFFGENKINFFPDDKSFNLRILNNIIPQSQVIEKCNKEEILDYEYDKEEVLKSFVSILYYAYKVIYKPNELFSEFCNEIIEEFNLEDYFYLINKIVNNDDFDVDYENFLSMYIFKLREIPDIDEYKKIIKPINILLNINQRRD